MMRFWVLLCVLQVVWMPLRAAWSHELQVEPVVVILRPQESFLTAEFNGNGEDIIQAVQVQESERIGHEEFQPQVQTRLEKYFNEHLLLQQSGQKLDGTLTHLEYWRPDDLDYTRSNFRAILRYERDAKLAEGAFQVTNRLFDYLPNAQAILSVAGIQKTLNPAQTVEFDPKDVRGNLLRNVRDFTVMGIEHIFTGPDHMLFIVALLLTASSFWSLAKTLTGFTIAHSITLILSALSVIVLPNTLVDIIIALSIIYVGLENIFWKNSEKHRFWVAGLFGLIHGFGFSYVLREIGLPDQGLAWSLLSFNLGVEIAQIAICAVAYPIIVRLRKKFEQQEQYGGMAWPKAMQIASWCVVAAGSYWMLERVTGT
jgi:hydrogenase/urease accessory protein HupE